MRTEHFLVKPKTLLAPAEMPVDTIAIGLAQLPIDIGSEFLLIQMWSGNLSTLLA